MRLILTPAGNDARVRSFMYQAESFMSPCEYGIQYSLDRAVTPLELRTNSSFRRQWIEGVVKQQTPNKPPHRIGYLDLEPHGGWLWQIASPNHPDVFDVEGDGFAMRDMLRVAKKRRPDVKLGYYRFPHFPRQTAMPASWRDSIRRVWDAVEEEVDYITVNQYLPRDETRNALERLVQAEEMMHFARELAGPNRPVFAMVWHSWQPTPKAVEHYVAIALAAQRAGADGLWCWADVQHDSTLTVELAKLRAFAPEWNRIVKPEFSIVPAVKAPSLRARALSAYASARGDAWISRSRRVGDADDRGEAA